MTSIRSTLLTALATLVGASANALTLPTNYGAGADAEVRESNPLQNRGSSTEIATRVDDGYSPGDGTGNDGSDRNSVIYLQFDLTPWVTGIASEAVVRLSFRNNNLTAQRLADTDEIAPDVGRYGLQVYGFFGAAFDEQAINYDTAPGLAPDGDIGTKDFGAGATLLGSVDLPAIGTQNHLPVGGLVEFSSGLLDVFLNYEADHNPSGVAVIALVHRNLGLSDGDPNATKQGVEPASWQNFNVLFNPKEQLTLNSDGSYEADISNPTGAGSPWSAADNSTGLFSPQLVLPGIEPELLPINIDFGDYYGEPPDTFGAAAGDPGVWNQVLNGTTPLVDIEGNPTPASVTLVSEDDGGQVGPATSDTELLLNDNFYNLDSSWSAQLEGLFPGAYRVFLYAPSNPSVSTGAVDVGGTPVANLSGDLSGTLIEGVTWTSVDVDVPAGDLTLSATCSGYCGVAGLQLVYLPEPSGTAGLASGVLLLGELMRQRRSVSRKRSTDGAGRGLG